MNIDYKSTPFLVCFFGGIILASYGIPNDFPSGMPGGAWFQTIKDLLHAIMGIGTGMVVYVLFWGRKS